jgi:hypothetical protein
MAEIVLGLATSHSPMLPVPADIWNARIPDDLANPELYFRGKPYRFDSLVAARRDEQIGREVTPQIWHRKHAACQAAIGTLADLFRDAKIDLAVIVGDDQKEIFDDDNFPAFSVFWGPSFENIPMGPDLLAKLPPGVAPAMPGYCPPDRTAYRGEPNLGKHIIRSLMADNFDIAQSTHLPSGPQGNNCVPHAYGFVYRKIMRDQVVPNVPVLINTFFPPNQPSAARCIEFGRALGRAIASWPQKARVAIIASGGLSHFVIDETFDREMIDALKRRDFARLGKVDEAMLQSGTSEYKNWLAVAAAMADRDTDMTLLDYVPCYRTDAGTGTAMGFAYWK